MPVINSQIYTVTRRIYIYSTIYTHTQIYKIVLKCKVMIYNFRSRDEYYAQYSYIYTKSQYVY
jgi:hypothetical protein